MKRFIILSFSLILSIAAAVAQEEAPDTLLSCATASNLVLRYTPGKLRITVEGINGTQDNFYYKETSVDSDDFSLTKIEASRITDVTVSETPKSVTLSFRDNRNEHQSYTFMSTDPSNRAVSSHIGRKGSDFGLTVSRSGKTVWDIISMGLGFGFSTPVSSNLPMNISMGRSLEWTWMEVLGVSVTRGAHNFNAGLGLHWQQLETVGDSYFVKNPDRTITMVPFSETQTNRHSEFNFFSLQIPLLYRFSFGHNADWRVTVGPIVNFNTGGHIKTGWNEGDSHYTVKTKHIGLRPVTVDAAVGFSWNGLGLYARYAPMQRLKDCTGLKFGTFSTGIIIGF